MWEFGVLWWQLRESTAGKSRRDPPHAVCHPGQLAMCSSQSTDARFCPAL